MKRKQIMLGLLTVIVATGAAFASVKKVQQTDAWYRQNPASPADCRHFGMVPCEPAPGNCERQIPDLDNASRQLYEEGCTSTLKEEIGF